MKRAAFLLLSIIAAPVGASAQTAMTTASIASPQVVYSTAPMPQPQRSNLGGGFIEFLFTGAGGSAQPVVMPEPRQQMMQRAYEIDMGQGQSQEQPPAVQNYAYAQPADIAPERPQVGGAFQKQEVDFDGPQKPGSIVIDTHQRFLFLVEPGHRALRYGVGVGREGFEWHGQERIARKAEWPDWHPPADMLKRLPYLPHYMPGGISNPLGARAMYLGSSLYRIHGSNEPQTIGQAVSSGCIRMRNEDVIDLYDRVKVGTPVTVL